MQQVHQEKETKFSKTCLYLTFLTQLQTNLLHLKLREVRSPEIGLVRKLKMGKELIKFSPERALRDVRGSREHP